MTHKPFVHISCKSCIHLSSDTPDKDRIACTQALFRTALVAHKPRSLILQTIHACWDRVIMLIDTFTVDSPSVSYSEEHITSSYEYDTNDLDCGVDGKYTVHPKAQNVQFQTTRRLPKLGYASDHAVPCLICLHGRGRTWLCCCEAVRFTRIWTLARVYKQLGISKSACCACSECVSLMTLFCCLV